MQVTAKDTTLSRGQFVSRRQPGAGLTAWQTAILSCLVSVALAGASLGAEATWLERWTALALDPASFRANLPELQFDEPQRPTADLITYYNAYDLHIPEYAHRFGTFESGDFIVSAHFFRPKQALATVILMHGYFDHSGTLSQTIRHLLSKGYAVAAYDMPGHGLSSGRAAHIDRFLDYEQVLSDFIAICKRQMPGPYHVIAHSTGAAVVTSRLLSAPEQDDFGAVILVAPLVRSAYWHLSAVSANVADLFMDDIPRVFRENSSDQAFLESVRDDPLQSHQASFEWMDALVEWNKRIATYPPSPRKVDIIQGDQDSIVDWDYNLAFLETKFPNARVTMIEGGKHQLLANGNRLITEAKAARIFEITPQGETVWEWIAEPYDEKRVFDVLEGTRYPDISAETTAAWACMEDR